MPKQRGPVLRPCRNLALTAILALFALAPAAARGEVQNVSATGTATGPCWEAGAGGPGVDSFEVTSPSWGYVRIELEGAGGDWDVAALSQGEVVTAAATGGSSEVATGFALEGEVIRVQGCRYPGASAGADIDVSFTPMRDPNGPAPKVLRVQVEDAAERTALETAGLDTTHSAGPGFADIVAYGPEDRATLAQLGLAYTTVDQNPGRGALRTARRAGEPMPSGRTSYRRLYDYQQEMKDLAAAYPALVEHFTLPHASLEGRAIEGIRIGDNPGADEGEPTFLQLGLHHGREWPAGEITFEWAYELLKGADAGDPEALRRLTDSLTIVVPVVNPDGFNLSREAGQTRFDYGVRAGDPMLGIPILNQEFQRKNCRIPGKLVGNCAKVDRFGLGVDPNRNYGVQWGGSGAGVVNNDETFRGPKPFSEPEVQNVQTLLTRNHVTATSSQHTYSALMLRPPGVRGTGPVPDASLLRRIGDEMGAETGYDSIRAYQLYDSSGVFDDFSYGVSGALTYTPEIGRLDFHPAFPQTVREWNGDRPSADGGMRAAFYTLSDAVVNESTHAVVAGTGPPGGRIELRKSFAGRTARVLKPNGKRAGKRRFRNRLKTSVAVAPDGSFEAHVNPSTSPLVAVRGGSMQWRVTCFDAVGTPTGQRPIEIERGQRIELDLASGC
jgi:hypothetical protein